MKRLFGSLYVRIAAAYLVLLLLFSALSVFATLRSAGRFAQESDQALNRGLAELLGARIAPFLGDSLDHGALKAAFTEFMRVNPRVDIYLLDEDGRILASSVDPAELEQQHVGMAPVQVFLQEGTAFPIRGDDPRSSGQDKIFSAAPVVLGAGRQGYVYVVLLSKLYDSVASLVRDGYVLRTAAVNLLLVFLFTGLAGLLVFAFLTRRFRAITRTVQAFEQGRFDRRIRGASSDELGQLARAVNGMADTIVEHMAALRERDRLRREFIANISHDLRSPLTSIQGYVETAIMKNEALESEERLQYLQIILEDTTRLGELIGQLLELSKLEAAQVRPKPEPFAACELVQDVLIEHRPQAQKLGLTLRTSLSRGLPMVEADIGMIERVLSNLIDNALRHTPRGGIITVGGVCRGGRVRIDVYDTGCGIPPEEIPHLSERFYKGQRGGARRSGGTGLGLAIVQKILELHGSELRIESTVGEGTKVSFFLPVADDGGREKASPPRFSPAAPEEAAREEGGHDGEDMPEQGGP